MLIVRDKTVIKFSDESESGSGKGKGSGSG